MSAKKMQVEAPVAAATSPTAASTENESRSTTASRASLGTETIKTVHYARLARDAILAPFFPFYCFRKKIRIHIPQKVKHIHHHKKIYITNHPASSQYAPAYLPTAEAMSLPTAVALPTVAGLVPLKPLPLYEERRSGPVPSIMPAESSLVPQYQARGFYGPAATWESHDFDLVPPPGPSGPTASAIPSAFSEPSAPAAAPSTKRVKIIKVQPRKKKIIRKKKPKRIIIQDMRHDEDGRPAVSSFHEQFYADLEGAGTIRKIKKPKRVEKIIDGNTEHIHTYSEEHIHKIVFDDSPKLAGLASMDPSGAGITALASNHPLLPIKNSQALLSLEPSLDQPLDFGGHGANLYSDIGTLGSFGTPGNLEYSNYNPREVTHDHVFHDHGELPPHLDISKEHLGTPPKASYTSHGLKMNGLRGKTRPKNKWVPQNNKPLRPSGSINDFSYYENLYPGPSPTPSPAAFSTRRPPRLPYQRPNYNEENDALSSQFHTDISFDGYKPIPSFRPRDKLKNYGPPSRYHGNDHKQGHRQLHSNSDIPFSTSSTVVHDVPQKPPRHSFSAVRDSPLSSLSNFKDPFTSFANIYSNNFENDAYASPSNSNPESPGWPLKGGKGKKKSISTQNISFGGQDHKTVVDHMADVSNIDMVVTDQRGAPVRNLEEDTLTVDSATPSAADYTITEYSPAHEYYTSMALKAFQDQSMSPESSNTNFQVVEAPTPQTTPTPYIAPSTSTARPQPIPLFFEERSTTIGTTSAPTYPSAYTMKIPKKPTHKSKHRNGEHVPRTRQVIPTSEDVRSAVRALERPHKKMVRFDDEVEQSRSEIVRGRPLPTPAERGKPRYGDKLAEESSHSF